MSNPTTVLPNVLLKSWKTGKVNDVNEPILIVELTDGTQFSIQMPGSTALAMGSALVALGNETTIKPDTKPN